MILLEAEEKMDKAIAVAREDFATIRTGRANAAMFNKISVDYYGTLTPLNQLASFQVPEARMIIITPLRQGRVLTAIEKAIRDSDLGINPNNDGNDHPRGPAGTDRRAPQGVHQGGASQGRGCA